MLARLRCLSLVAVALACGACGSDDEPTGAASGDPGPAAASSGAGGVGPSGRSVDVVRDARGVPHVFAETLPDAMYGLGWATAEDRLYQMDFSRRWMRGRLAELFGPGADGAVLEQDIRLRTLGFARHADAIAGNLPEDVRAALEAYAAGVNAKVTSDGFSLPPAFATAGIEAFEPWTPADSLLAWERMREIFGGDDSRLEIDRLDECK